MAFTWRTIDAELAELVFDSARDELVGFAPRPLRNGSSHFKLPALRSSSWWWTIRGISSANWCRRRRRM